MVDVKGKKKRQVSLVGETEISKGTKKTPTIISKPGTVHANIIITCMYDWYPNLRVICWYLSNSLCETVYMQVN